MRRSGRIIGYENLLIYAKIYGLSPNHRKEAIREALESIGLDTIANNLVKTYSGGMIRRLNSSPMEGSPMNTEEPIKGARNELNVVISSTTFWFTGLFMCSPAALYYMGKDIIITHNGQDGKHDIKKHDS